MKVILDRSDFGKNVQVYLHEKTLPDDKDKETYYLTQQVVNRFRHKMKIKQSSNNKTFVDLEDLLTAMLPVIIKSSTVRKLDKNAELSICVFFRVVLFF